ncbi:MAG: hypothetical protein VCC04_09865 [Myxococcota bacterium]
MTRSDSGRLEPSERTPLLCIAFENEAALRAAYRADMARGGVFVATHDPPDLHRPVEVEFQLGEARESLRLQGDVVGRQLPDGPDEPGVAVAFRLPASEVRRLFESRIPALVDPALFLGSLDSAFRVVAGALSASDPVADPLEASVLDLADSGLSLGRMLAVIPEPEDRVRRSVASLLEKGLLQAA